MRCRSVRNRLTAAAAGRRTDRLDAHLAGCADCRRYAERLEGAGRALAAHHAGYTPDPAFAARVRAALPEPPGEMALAALRLLPASLALALALAGWAVVATPGPGELVAPATVESAVDDPLSWAIETAENGETGNGGDDGAGVGS